jgi:AcrR family transcriptional regulator
VLAERGLDMEVSEVAERAEVGVGTLYRHFANRDDLVRAVLAQSLEDIRTCVRDAAEIEDPCAALRQVPFALIAGQTLFTVMQDPRAAKLAQDMKAQMNQSVSDEVIALLAGIIERGVQRGVFRADLDPQATALAVLGSIGAVCGSMAATHSLAELAGLLADLHACMVGVH